MTALLATARLTPAPDIAQYIHLTDHYIAVVEGVPPLLDGEVSAFVRTLLANNPALEVRSLRPALFARLARKATPAETKKLDTTPKALARQILADAVALYKQGREVSDVFVVSRAAGVHEVRFEVFSNLMTHKVLSAAGIRTLQDGFWNIGTSGNEYSAPTLDGAESAFFTYSGPEIPEEIFSIRAQYRNTVADGRTLVIRLTFKTKDGVVRRLTELGYEPATVRLLTSVAEGGTGGIILAGEIGHGKTMTAYALLYEDYLYRQSLGIHSAFYSREQPPERVVPWMDQITIKADEDWIPAGRDLLRMALKVELIGEIRGIADAASFADHAAIFKVYATYHGADALTTLIRFYQMGVPDYQLCNPQVFRVIVAQRLLPVLCPHCSIPWCADPAAEPTMTALLEHTGLLSTARRRGSKRSLACTGCDDGAIGKRPIVEIFENDGDTAEQILKHPSAGRRTWIANGATTMGMQAMRLIRDGVVDPRYVHRLLPLKANMADFAAAGMSLFDTDVGGQS